MRTMVLFGSIVLLGGCTSLERYDACGRCCDPQPCPEYAAAASADPYVAAAARSGDGSRAIWAYLSERYDADRDGRVTPAEYGRSPDTFRRLDADADGALTAADFRGPTSMEEMLAEFTWQRIAATGPKANASHEEDWLEADALAAAFARVDANGNGVVGEREILAALRAGDSMRDLPVPRFPQGVAPWRSIAVAMDADGSDGVTMAEAEAWRARWEAKAKAEATAEKAKAPSDAGPAGPPARQPAKQPTSPPANPPAAASPPRAPRGVAVGQPAADFTLETADGRGKVALASFRGVKPVVLIFGSYTCPPFRHVAARLREIARTHGDAAQFLFVYVREAHAVDGRAPMPSADQPLVETPINDLERRTVASSCLLDLGFTFFPTLVDGIGNEVERAYAAAPARVYVVGRDGIVAYRGGPGPFGLDADAIEAAVKDAIAKGATAATEPTTVGAVEPAK